MTHFIYLLIQASYLEATNNYKKKAISNYVRRHTIKKMLELTQYWAPCPQPLKIKNNNG